MAIVDANYQFILCDIGTNGRVSDGGAIENTSFYRQLKNKTLNIPSSDAVSVSSQTDRTDVRTLNYVFVGDEAFTLRTDFLKPYSQKDLTVSRKIYNYRLSRARRIVENAFGILANRFRIFHSAINLKIPNVEKVVLACCALHNFLRRKSPSTYTPDETFDTENHETGMITPGLRSEFIFDIENGHNRQSSKEAKQIRVDFENYFNGEGAVPWQNKMM